MITALLGIAEEFGVSHQAVCPGNIKRTEKTLEDYEMKLHMYSDYIVRSQIFDQILERYPRIIFCRADRNFNSIDNRIGGRKMAFVKDLTERLQERL